MNQKNIIIANWKMNHSFDEAEQWINQINELIAAHKKQNKNLCEIVLCPPAILLDHIDGLLMEEEISELEAVYKNLDNIAEHLLENFKLKSRDINLGGQDCHQRSNGAFTGDISAKTLHDCGCKYVILGHSERRQYHFESNQIVAAKAKTALEQGLIPVICIGESKKLRKDNNYLPFLKEQIENSIPDNINIEKLIIAYEPVWSIGSGLIPQNSQIEEAADFIKEVLDNNKKLQIKNYTILYGGSVNKDNAGSILKIKNINGLLVGSASLEAKQFFDIIKLACR